MLGIIGIWDNEKDLVVHRKWSRVKKYLISGDVWLSFGNVNIVVVVTCPNFTNT